ncbi:helix-turn-helix domain-containing protein [Cohnella sp.]|uniref:helix-turn-helix domain-containing protein n=1 Tax=Cohnella sp. TaxID=1883426 RepID=UPI003567CBF5
MIVYDKKKVGQRIRKQREALEISREQLAERIGRVPRFCADIERGKAGMSIETMFSICNLLKLSPNELLLGQEENATPYDETALIMAALNQCTEKQRKDALALLKLFLTAIR